MSAPAGREADAAAVMTLLGRVAGLRTDDDRSGRIAAAVEEAMRAADVSPAGYLDVLEHDPTRFQELIRRVTVGESHFFREPGHFELLRGRILPALRRERPATHRLQLWTAGCAAGEEAYSIAILLEELGLTDHVDLLATDISAEALERARAANYRPWSLRGVDEARQRAYFRPTADGFELDRRFVGRVSWRLVNLVADPYPQPSAGAGFDVIFCRNVLIYLTAEAVADVARRLTAALAPGGWLVTASTDPHLSSLPGLETVVTREGVAYRRTPPGADRRSDTRVDTSTRVVAATTTASSRSRAPRRIRRRRVDAVRRDVHPTAPAPIAAEAVIDAETEYRRAMALLDEGRWDAAARAARNALYLQPDLVVAEVALGRALLHLDDPASAARSWRNAEALLERLDGHTPVPLAGGTSAGRLRAELAVLRERSPVVPR